MFLVGSDYCIICRNDDIFFFYDISDSISYALDRADYIQKPSLEEILLADQQARAAAMEYLRSRGKVI